MDKLKENLFGIGVAVVVVVLLAMGWFLVWTPLSKLRSARADLETQTANIRKDIKKGDDLETQRLKKHLEEVKAENEADLAEAVASYDERAAKYSLYFDENDRWTGDAASFTSSLRDKIAALRASYRTEFELVVDENLSEDESPPFVANLEPAQDDEVAGAMREFWVVSEVFRALGELEIGGLEKISFPGRSETLKNKKTYYEVLPVLLDLRMPFLKIENFLTALFASDRVPFQLVDLLVRKDQEVLKGYENYVITKEYESKGKSDTEAYAELHPEPSVIVTIRLEAIHWTGIPQPEDTPEDKS